MRYRLEPLLIVLLLFTGKIAHAQSFGIELHNTLMPAAGGMAGVSLTRPQDYSLRSMPIRQHLRSFMARNFHSVAHGSNRHTTSATMEVSRH